MFNFCEIIGVCHSNNDIDCVFFELDPLFFNNGKTIYICRFRDKNQFCTNKKAVLSKVKELLDEGTKQ